MKLRLLFLSLALAFVSTSGVRAEEAKPSVKADKPETELEKKMAKMNKPWRQIRAAARDGKLTPAMAEWVAAMRIDAAAAAKLTPELEGERPVAERAKFQEAYQAQMEKLIAAFGELEAALRANDLPGATKLVGEIGDLRKSGHKHFKKPDEH